MAINFQRQLQSKGGVIHLDYALFIENGFLHIRLAFGENEDDWLVTYQAFVNNKLLETCPLSSLKRWKLEINCFGEFYVRVIFFKKDDPAKEVYSFQTETVVFDESTVLPTINIEEDDYGKNLQRLLEFAPSRNYVAKSDFNKVVQPLLSKLNALYALGFTLPAFCSEMEYGNVTIYAEEKHWTIAEPVFLSFKLGNKIKVKNYISDSSWSRDDVSGNFFYNKFTAKARADIPLTKDDTVFILKPEHDQGLLNSLSQTGARVFELPLLLDQIRDYFIYEKPLLEISNRHKDVGGIVIKNMPKFPAVNLSAGEQIIDGKGIWNVDHGLRNELLKSNAPIIPAWDAFHYNNADISEMLSHPADYIDAKGVLVFADKSGTYVNLSGGNRVTANAPKDIQKTIYIVGGDKIFGMGAPDGGTVSSHLQNKLNEQLPDQKIAVVNMGRFLWPRQYELLHLLNSLPVKDGDIIVFHAPWTWSVRKAQVLQLDFSNLLQRPHDYGEVFIDKGGHLNENGYRAIADAVFKALRENYLREDKGVIV
jgi:[citrate (pro-3S)-lyase] ligase